MAYFTVEEFRDRYPDLTGGAGLGKYPDATVDYYRDIAEQAYEDAILVALEPRQATETVYTADSGMTVFFLERPRVRAIVSVKDAANADVSYAGSTINAGTVTLSTGWGTSGPLTVTYTHGYDEPPARDKQAVMILTRAWMVQGPVDERAVQIATDAGNIPLSTPGQRGAIFGIPEVDAAAARWPVQRVTIA